jgi:hypothetical protein
MLNRMSEPQQPPVPPYASNAPQPPQPGYPVDQAPNHQQYYQGQAPQGYAQPGYPANQTGANSPSDSNAPGKVGFILGLVAVGLQVLLSVIIQIMIRSQGYDLISLVSGVVAVIIFLAGVGALVFGLIGLKRAGSKTFAGIATGLGIAVVVSAGFNFILNAISSLLYF